MAISDEETEICFEMTNGFAGGGKFFLTVGEDEEKERVGEERIEGAFVMHYVRRIYWVY